MSIISSRYAQAHRFSIAPMLNWTDRHDRFFLRLISQHALLYTEMITTGALLHGGDPGRFLRFHEDERPLALQLGGSHSADLKLCAKMAADFGYDEVNLNCGCPSDRVQRGRFGACLMAEPDLVAESLAAMAESGLPATLKTRIGVDNQDSYEFLHTLVEKVRAAGAKTVVIHARKAWLQGLSPKENRDIPPLQYHVVERVKRDFPDLTIVLNGGLKTLESCQEQLQKIDGVMMGREAYQNPYIMAQVDRLFFDREAPIPSRGEIVERLYCYAKEEVRGNVSIKSITRHVLGLFNGLTGARAWRRYLSENAFKPDADAEIIPQAYEAFLKASTGAHKLSRSSSEVPMSRPEGFFL